MTRQSLMNKLWKIMCVCVLFLLYWSTNLLEQDIKQVQVKMRALDEDMQEILRLMRHQRIEPSSVANEAQKQVELQDIGDPLFVNLLQDDEYKKRVLPDLLGSNFTPKGTLRVAHIGKPDNLSPFNGFEHVVRCYELCVPGLVEAHVGKDECFAPGLALKIEEHDTNDGSGDKEYHVYLRPHVYWAPIDAALFPADFQLADVFQSPHLVTAHDFKFYYDAVMNPYLSDMRAVSLRAYFEDIVSFRVEGDHKFIVRWKAHSRPHTTGNSEKKVLYSAFFNTLALQPLPCFVYQYFANGEKIIADDHAPDTYRNNSIWAQNFSSHWANNYIVSCGAFHFAGMDDEKIIFIRNSNFYDPYAALVEKRYIYLKDSADSIFQDFKSGKLDMISLQPAHVENLERFMQSAAYQEQKRKGEAICNIEGLFPRYSYIGWNCNSLLFSNVQVRRAMNMLVDRTRMIEQCCGGYGIEVTGPFALCSSAYNAEVPGWYYSKDEAIFLLEEEGWIDRDGDGIREKEIDGVMVPFRFRLSYYVKSDTSRMIAEYLAMVCKEVGIECQLAGVDMADYSRAFDEKNFDAFLGGWCLGSPPEDPRALWHSEGAQEKGSANLVGFQNTEADQIIEQLHFEYNKEARIQLYHRFHEIIHQEAPYAFLWTQTAPIVYRSYVKNIFVPAEQTHLIPDATSRAVYSQALWLARSDEEC